MAQNHRNQGAIARQRVQDMQVLGVRDYKRSVLLAMLNHLPAPGLRNIQQDIAQCADEDALNDLATHYIISAFKPMKATGGKTPEPSPSPEVDGLEESPESSQAHLSSRVIEERCLSRDGYRCVVTGACSIKTPEHLLPVGYNHNLLEDTQTCLIIPLSMAQHGDSQQAREDAPRTWNSLCRMFPSLHHHIVDGNFQNINNPLNQFTATWAIHNAFSQFNLAFQQTGQQDRYQLRHWQIGAMLHPHLQGVNVVQFTNHSNNTNTPLPHPYLLEIHHVIAEILNASGLGAELDKVFEEYDSLGGLASDGSTQLPFLIECKAR